MLPAFPAASPWTAPGHWRAIDLLSDLHLCPALPRTFEAFARHLRQTDADAVFVLGDLFEVWIGDDQAFQHFERECLAVIEQASRRLWVGLMVGNRDFLLGPQALAAAGAHPLPDPTVLHAFGARWLLTHGDALCTADVEYQTFRNQVRSPAWQQAFLARPQADRAAVAARVRAESRARKSALSDADDWADVDGDASRHWLAASGAPVLLHGHTHRPGRHALGAGLSREVLSDWDLDAAPARAEVLRLSARGLERRPPEGWLDAPA
jgi:UDP-2,3-diacylglucosamine hydrolase